MANDSFTAEDLRALGRIVADTWRAGLDRDWSVPAGTLDWSCWATADHVVDCVFSYALLLASRREDAYPPFDLLRALPEATPADLVNGLEAVTTMLLAVIETADPAARAVLSSYPTVETGSPQDFAPRGAHEMIVHTHDICSGLDVPFDPPQDLCRRLRDHTSEWPDVVTFERPVEPRPTTDDAWSDLLERAGRARLT
jgi:hypothetical protein